MDFGYCELDNTHLLGLYVKELMKRQAFIFIQVANNKDVNRLWYGWNEPNNIIIVVESTAKTCLRRL